MDLVHLPIVWKSIVTRNIQIMSEPTTTTFRLQNIEKAEKHNVWYK